MANVLAEFRVLHVLHHLQELFWRRGWCRVNRFTHARGVAESHFLLAESTFLLAEPHFAREDGSKTALSTQIQHLP